VAPFHCRACGNQNFSSLNKLNEHRKSVHGAAEGWDGEQFKELGYECRPCKGYFPSKASLLKHISIRHDPDSEEPRNLHFEEEGLRKKRPTVLILKAEEEIGLDSEEVDPLADLPVVKEEITSTTSKIIF